MPGKRVFAQNRRIDFAEFQGLTVQTKEKGLVHQFRTLKFEVLWLRRQTTREQDTEKEKRKDGALAHWSFIIHKDFAKIARRERTIQ